MTKNVLKKNKIRIIVTGGGTGGHVKPLMAVVSELQKHHCDILYIGSGVEIERVEAKKHQIKYRAIFTGKWRRYFSWQNYLDLVKVKFGFFQSIFIILSFKPDAVFAKGGYVSLPVNFAAWILGVPIVVHETDVILGLANRLVINKIKKLCVGFPVRYYENLPVNKIAYTGNPISKEYFVNLKSQISNNKFQTILITGGSQGSRFINQTIAAILGKLTEKYNIIHQCGKLDYEWLSKNSWKNYKLFDFTDKLVEYMKSADLVISRSGGAIMEIAACQKPAIFIPLSSSASNHQEMNARVIEKANAAIVLREKGLTSESLLEIIDRILEDKKMQSDLGQKISQFSQPDAAKNISDIILKEVKNLYERHCEESASSTKQSHI